MHGWIISSLSVSLVFSDCSHVMDEYFKMNPMTPSDMIGESIDMSVAPILLFEFFDSPGNVLHYV